MANISQATTDRFLAQFMLFDTRSTNDVASNHTCKLTLSRLLQWQRQVGLSLQQTCDTYMYVSHCCSDDGNRTSAVGCRLQALAILVTEMQQVTDKKIANFALSPEIVLMHPW